MNTPAHNSIRPIAAALLLAVAGTAAATPTDAPDLFSAVMAKQSTNAETDRISANLWRDPSVLSVTPINVDTDLLRVATPKLDLNVSSRSGWASKLQRSYALDGDTMVWEGTLDLAGTGRKADGRAETGTALFVVNGDHVFGQMLVDGVPYEIMSNADASGYLLVKRDFTRLPKTDDTPAQARFAPRHDLHFDAHDEAHARGAAKNVLAPGPVIPGPVVPGPIIVLPPLQATVRVLQVATPGAVTTLGSQENASVRMNFFLAQANQVYTNNAIPLRLQNAGLLFPNAAQPSTDGTVLIANMDNQADGYLDAETSVIRDALNADLVGLITSDPLTSPFGGLCGIASGIGVAAAEGFFVVNSNCTDYTFVHEIGHLFGARHDNDPGVVPYAYGHGFVNAGCNLRTVMAVNANPQPRVGYFSTDDQTLGGCSLGNAGTADNERVHWVRRFTVAGFQ